MTKFCVKCTQLYFFIGVMVRKAKSTLVKLVSSEGTGVFFVKKRNPKTLATKLEFRKYDPRVRKHVLFKEAKIK